jgi:hypothetical protein
MERIIIEQINWDKSKENTRKRNLPKPVEDSITSTQTQTRSKGTPLSPQGYSGIEFTYKYPNDKNYIYGVKDDDWYAKNINNQKVFNISKDGFQSSVDRLNKEFPNAFNVVKDENKLEPNVQVKSNETKFKSPNLKSDKGVDSTPKYQTKTDSLTTDKNVSNKQQEPTIYNIDSNNEEL